MAQVKSTEQKLKNVMVIVALAIFFFFVPSFIVKAEELSSATELSLQISSLPEAKLSVKQTFTFPVLQGSSPLTSGNNIKTVIGAEVSPISLAAMTEVIWTPIAFIELNAGGRLGSGWNIPIANGIGLNAPVGNYAPGNPRKAEIDGSAFDGLQWRAWLGGAFQFDLAAVVPGDWNHVIIRAYDELRYSGYTRAGSGDSWIFENDDGENRNGWTWQGSVVLGYQMPLSPILDFVGLMGELEYNLYNTPGWEYWGDNYVGNNGRMIFSGLFNFNITPRFNTSLIFQMRTRRNYGSSDLENLNELWYQDMELQKDGGSRRLLFYRAALIFSYRLR
jgi:hypothetical protein